MDIKHSNGSDPDFISLCRQLDQFLNELAGGEENRAEYIPYNALDDIRHSFLAYQDGIAVGCASFKEFEPGVAEVKRVFVKPEYRGDKIAGRLLTELEKEAGRQGYHTLVLETGDALVSAAKLYKRIGFCPIDNYGPYINMPKSVCMKKAILPSRVKNSE